MKFLLLLSLATIGESQFIQKLKPAPRSEYQTTTKAYSYNNFVPYQYNEHVVLDQVRLNQLHEYELGNAEVKRNETDAEKLSKDLFENYDWRIKPPNLRLNGSTLRRGTTVMFALYIIELLSINDEKMYLEMRTWLELSFHDPRLMWNASKYDGITMLTKVGQINLK